MPPPRIDFHPSVGERNLEQDAIESLDSNRIDPKFLYVTPRQADLWRQVFLRHSPLHGNPEFARIYRDAFALVLERFTPAKIMLLGLGCGTGSKELDLLTSLKAGNRTVSFAAIDVSRDLVGESAGRLIAAGAAHERSLVCDLGHDAFLAEWLTHLQNDLPRLITFFGLVPNFPPALVSRIFRAVLRPGDLLLVSAHLAPVVTEKAVDIASAMELVLPQYDNPETLAWLSAALENWDVDKLVAPPEIKIGEIDGIPAFLGSATWKTRESFEKWGRRFSRSGNEPLLLFQSLRYTPALFEKMLRGQGFDAEQLAITVCRQEAIWAVRLPAA